jgi:hypothetical protein
MKPRIITSESLSDVDPSKECFVLKNSLDKNLCLEIVEFLKEFSKKHDENIRHNGENWHYFVRSNNNYFDSFLFNELCSLKFEPLIFAYKNLYNLYNLLGESTEINDFEKEIKISNFKTDFRIINPLVFCYFNEKSQFGFHKHDIRNQKFQLLTNLTQPNHDYLGGDTWVYMVDGKPDPNDVYLKEKCVIFDNEFELGDTFCFPYDKWHKVDQCFDASYKGGARFSLLMPLGVRNNEEYSNEII